MRHDGCFFSSKMALFTTRWPETITFFNECVFFFSFFWHSRPQNRLVPLFRWGLRTRKRWLLNKVNFKTVVKLSPKVNSKWNPIVCLRKTPLKILPKPVFKFPEGFRQSTSDSTSRYFRKRAFNKESFQPNKSCVSRVTFSSCRGLTG